RPLCGNIHRADFDLDENWAISIRVSYFSRLYRAGLAAARCPASSCSCAETTWTVPVRHAWPAVVGRGGYACKRRDPVQRGRDDSMPGIYCLWHRDHAGTDFPPCLYVL